MSPTSRLEPTRPAPPRRFERVAVLGLGKAGGALIASLTQAGVTVVARARRVDALLKARALRDAQVLFLAVPDGALEEVAASLAARFPKHLEPPVVAHLAGARGLDALHHLEGRAHIASFHPLASLNGREPIPAGTLIAWDASRAADGRRLAALARRLELTPARITDKDRVRYHAGAVVAGNLPVALLAWGTRLLTDAGVPEPAARRALARLLLSQAENALAEPLPRALTGPVARGDVNTLRRHLALLDAEEPALAGLYRALSRDLVDGVTAHPPAVKRALRMALER